MKFFLITVLFFLFFNENLLCQDFIQFGGNKYTFKCNPHNQCEPQKRFLKKVDVEKYYHPNTLSFTFANPPYTEYSITSGITIDSIIYLWNYLDSISITIDSLAKTPIQFYRENKKQFLTGYEIYIINDSTSMIKSDDEASNNLFQTLPYIFDKFKNIRKIIFTNLYFRTHNSTIILPFELVCNIESGPHD